MAVQHYNHFWLEISDLKYGEDQMEDKILYAADPVIGQRRVCNYVLFMVGDDFVCFAQVNVALIMMTVLCCG